MYCDLWLQYINVRKLFKGGNYSIRKLFAEIRYLLPNKKEFKSAARSHPKIKICHKRFDRMDIEYVS